jgi:hypothetical protein
VQNYQEFGAKTQGYVVNVLYKEQIKHLKEVGKWPGVWDCEERYKHHDLAVID